MLNFIIASTMKIQESKKKLKEERKELKNLLKKTKRPANKLFLEARLQKIELMINPKIGSSNPYGIANFC